VKNDIIIVRSPFRLSFFGGSSDYKEFYEKSGSLLIGTTINKYNYICIRNRPNIMPNKSVAVYSKMEEVSTFDEISNPLIRETLKYFNPNNPIEFNSFTDVPGRTGLGGSSSYCVGLCYALRKILDLELNKKIIATDAIKIEREILNEYGGIQDQIWASYGGLNSITIDVHGNFFVRPLPVTSNFESELESSIVLLYTGSQRFSDKIAKDHKDKDKTGIHEIAKEAYNLFSHEKLPEIGKLLYETWKEKEKISPLISTNEINVIIKRIMELGAYGAKLIGSGGCGFIMAICDPISKKRIVDQFHNLVLDVKFDKEGVHQIYSE
jgi:D-glycero-alpha-D-manno-heptose-7-phosphate kinase